MACAHRMHIPPPRAPDDCGAVQVNQVPLLMLWGWGAEQYRYQRQTAFALSLDSKVNKAKKNIGPPSIV